MTYLLQLTLEVPAIIPPGRVARLVREAAVPGTRVVCTTRGEHEPPARRSEEEQGWLEEEGFL